MKSLIIFCLFLGTTLAEQARFDHYRVHRLIPKNEAQLKALSQMENDNEYNFWTEPTSVYAFVDVMVPPHKRADFADFIRDTNIQEDLLIKNVQELIDNETKIVQTRAGGVEWTNYHTLEEFNKWMIELTQKYKFVKSITVGKSYEKRDIKGIEITFGENYKTVVIESMIHAREWISTAATSWVVNEILQSPASSIFRKFNYIYIPFYNPDGYAYTWSTNRMWRKTRTPYKKGSQICYGADPNRNWGFHWNEAGCSNDPCSEIYCGPKAFSEVETKTISEYLSKVAKEKKIDVYLAFHSYSQLIMYPWGYSPNPAPHKKIWQRIGEEAAKDLAAVNKETFKVGDIYHAIYPSSGSSMEWFYGNYNNTIAFIFELRDKGKYGFVLPPQYILPSAKELFAAVQRILIEYDKLPKAFKDY